MKMLDKETKRAALEKKKKPEQKKTQPGRSRKVSFSLARPATGPARCLTDPSSHRPRATRAHAARTCASAAWQATPRRRSWHAPLPPRQRCLPSVPSPRCLPRLACVLPFCRRPAPAPLLPASARHLPNPASVQSASSPVSPHGASRLARLTSLTPFPPAAPGRACLQARASAKRSLKSDRSGRKERGIEEATRSGWHRREVERCWRHLNGATIEGDDALWIDDGEGGEKLATNFDRLALALEELSKLRCENEVFDFNCLSIQSPQRIFAAGRGAFEKAFSGPGKPLVAKYRLDLVADTYEGPLKASAELCDLLKNVHTLMLESEFYTRAEEYTRGKCIYGLLVCERRLEAGRVVRSPSLHTRRCGYRPTCTRRWAGSPRNSSGMHFQRRRKPTPRASAS